MKRFELTSFDLHIIAMLCMTCDHIWGVLLTGYDWLHWLGRLAFPLFAFLLVEGYFHTKNFKKYYFRILVFAILSEIPFNLMISSQFFYPFHQNVLWSFLIGLTLIHFIEKAKTSKHRIFYIIAVISSIIIGSLLGIVCFVDYYHAGILMILVFYLFKERTLICTVLKVFALYYINRELLGGLGYELTFFNHTVFISIQSFALFALIPIGLYKGKQGPYSKAIKWFYYAFYPLHILLITFIKFYVL